MPRRSHLLKHTHSFTDQPKASQISVCERLSSAGGSEPIVCALRRDDIQCGRQHRAQASPIERRIADAIRRL